MIALAAATLLFGVMSSNDRALAVNFAPFGDHGDAQAVDRCPAKQYLVGLFVRVGDWMDQMGIICAPLDANGNTGAPYFGPGRGGNGGASPVNVTCAVNEIVVGVGLLMTPDNRQVRMLRFNCASFKAGTHHDIDIGNTTHGQPSNIRQDCPADEAITGVTVNFGVHVNAFGAMCGAKPTPLPPPVTPPVGGGSASTVPLTADQTAILAAHNAYRQTCGAPSLVWDAGLAANAQNWANGCHTDAQGNFCHQYQPSSQCPGAPGGNANGESTSFGWRTTRQGSGPDQPVIPGQSPGDAVKGWYCEVTRFPFDSTSPTIAGGFTGSNCSGTATGHFTQVVWKSTMRIGCATHTCPVPGKAGLTGTLWVCEYAPAGNVNTAQQILANVSKSCARQP